MFFKNAISYQMFRKTNIIKSSFQSNNIKKEAIFIKKFT